MEQKLTILKVDPTPQSMIEIWILDMLLFTVEDCDETKWPLNNINWKKLLTVTATQLLNELIVTRNFDRHFK